MIRIKGLDTAYRQLERLRLQGQKASQRISLKMAKMIQYDAKEYVPVDLGKLKQSIGVEATETGAIVYVGESWGAFQEFGTGIYVDVPAELADEATKFKGYKSRKSTDFIESIKEWCIRHGIDERAAYPIAMSILRKGLHPQPYFYPAIQKNRGKLVDLIQKELDKINA